MNGHVLLEVGVRGKRFVAELAGKRSDLVVYLDGSNHGSLESSGRKVQGNMFHTRSMWILMLKCLLKGFWQWGQVAFTSPLLAVFSFLPPLETAAKLCAAKTLTLCSLLCALRDFSLVNLERILASSGDRFRVSWGRTRS